MPDIFELAWQKLKEKEEHSLSFDDSEEAFSDATETVILVCGSQNSGKTTLIQRFMGTTAEDSKTFVLEYRFLSRMRNNKKEVSSIWELGGGHRMVKLITTPMSAATLENTALVVFLDLSLPFEIPEIVVNIMKNVNDKVTVLLKELNHLDPKKYDKLQKVTTKWASHKDRGIMNCLPFPITFIAARYDLFQNMESEKKKQIYKFIRYAAHINCANILTFTTSIEVLVAKCKSLLSFYAFHDSKPSLPQNTDVMNPLYVTAGSDSLESIGHITGAGIPSSNYRDAMTEWKEAFQDNFPLEDSAKKQTSSDIVGDKKFAEYEIDIAVEEKHRELEMFIREKRNRKALAEKSQQKQTP